MKKIKLTLGKKATVDDEDFKYLNKWNWYASKGYNTFYAVRMSGKPRRAILMHRLILKTPKEKDVDHIDGNGLNNQKTNIRNCTRSQNLYNQYRKNSCGFKGIRKIVINCSKKTYCYYVSRIMVMGKGYYLGCFKTPTSAAIAYNNAAIKYHKGFAKLNIM